MKKLVGSKKKVRISIAIDTEFLAWIDQMMKRGVFASRSHAIHRALLRLKEEVTRQLLVPVLFPTYSEAENIERKIRKVKAG